ncbi:hypothetical protein HMPREF9148_01905 [Prevotella sp. F0091]|nr:hypothetical protein HMPREF9148_01905 [Prevotella sp. F0091]
MPSTKREQDSRFSIDDNLMEQANSPITLGKKDEELIKLQSIN